MPKNFSGTNSELTEDSEEALFGDLVTSEDAEVKAEETPAEETAPDVAEPEEGLQDSPEEETPDAPEVSTEEEASPSGEEPASSDSPDPAEVDWKKRYDDIRKEQMGALERQREITAQYEEMLTNQYVAAQAPSQVDVNALAAQAEAAGIDPEQMPFFVELAKAVTSQQMAPLNVQAAQMQAAREAEAMAIQQMQTTNAVEQFRAAKPDITPEMENEMVSWLANVGALQALPEGGYAPAEPLSTEILDIAHEAVNNPELGKYLLTHPDLYETDEGIAEARVLASVIANNGAPTTQTKPTRTTRDAAAAVAAAAVLGGPAAPAAGEEEELFVKPSSDIHFSK